MVQTPDGDLVMFVMKARRVGTPESHVHPIRSSDGGLTWGPMGEELALFGAFTEPHTMDHALITNDGHWMLPIYGGDEPGDSTYAAVAFSSDMGRTWGHKTVVARSSEIVFYEPAVTRLPDGRFMAVIRTQDPPFDSYQSYSADEGRTWTEPCHLSHSRDRPRSCSNLRSGDIACFYRDRDRKLPGVSVSVTTDGGRTVVVCCAGLSVEPTGTAVIPLWSGSPNGLLFCVYYSCYEAFNSEVHGAFFSEDE